jgi:hypothetical protein
MNDFQDGGLLHFDHPVCHQTKELGHKAFYSLSLVDKLQANREVFPLATSCAFCMEAVVIAEAGLWTEHGNSSNLLVVKKSQNVIMKKLTARADVRVQMNHDPQRRPNIKHPHSL